jgi:divalent metal cation (Fe/Co/Zn/Cd) transporter
MDATLSAKEIIEIKQVLDRHKVDKIEYHALYTRQAASKRFISFHLLFPGEYTVHHAHEIAKLIETDLAIVFPNSDVFIHIESLNVPDAFDDNPTASGL